MAYLIVAIVALTALALVQLLFTLAVIRRLREHGERLARLSAANPAGPAQPIGPGEVVGPFAARALDGSTITEADLHGEAALVGFFTPTCEPCREQLPLFVQEARRRSAFAFVIDEGPASEAAARTLAEVTRVALVAPDSPVIRAFSAVGFPLVVEVDGDGVVVASDHVVATLAGAR